MNHQDFNAHEALSQPHSWQNRQGRANEWERRPLAGSGVVWGVVLGSMFAVFAAIVVAFA